MRSPAPETPEFYIGYQPRAPEPVARRMRLTAGLLSALAVVVAVGFALAMNPFDRSRFEFGTVRQFEGVLESDPYPVLRGGERAPGGDASRSRDAARGGRVPAAAPDDWILVAPGKHGAEDSVRPFDGLSVRLEGTLIERAGARAIEIVPGSIRPLADSPLPTATREEPAVLGAVTVEGEIVDSKCFLGVMNPGRGKVHRDCAVRCISGGIPPALVVRRVVSPLPGSESPLFAPGAVVLLTGTAGEPLCDEVIPFAAQTVTIAGTLVRSGSTLSIRFDPRSLR
jgi:hypothetical protein